MFAERVAEEPSMSRKALRAIMPAVPSTLEKQQNIGTEPQDDLNSPQPDSSDKTNMDETGYKAPISAYGDELKVAKGQTV